MSSEAKITTSIVCVPSRLGGMGYKARVELNKGGSRFAEAMEHPEVIYLDRRSAKKAASSLKRKIRAFYAGLFKAEHRRLVDAAEREDGDE